MADSPSRRSRWGRGVRLGCALGWTLVVMVLLLRPASPLPPQVPHLDKLVHLALFATHALAWCWAGVSGRAVVVSGVVLGGVAEIAQGLLGFGRVADAWDVVANAVGVVAGVSGWRWSGRE